MSTINRIIYECLDAALSSFDTIDKEGFYNHLLEKYKIDSSKFSEKFDKVHEALTDYFGINHYRIERSIIRTLNTRAKQGIYDRNDEITAFSSIVSVFMKETERNIAKNREIAKLSAYATTLENKVKDAEEKMRAGERMIAIGQTAAMVGHDIRNPLQAIVGELFLEKTEIVSLPDGETKKSLEESTRAIEENIFYINKIVSDLQDFAKPITAEKGEVDINIVIADVLAMVPIPVGIQVQIHVEDNFPCISASYQMLKRALSNLIQNAAQAMPTGGKLTITAYVEGKNGKIVVQDSGEGIPEEVKSNIFKPLFTTKSKGQGLGLAVVKRLIEAQDGRVCFESKIGDGAKFIITLPLITGNPP